MSYRLRFHPAADVTTRYQYDLRIRTQLNIGRRNLRSTKMQTLRTERFDNEKAAREYAERLQRILVTGERVTVVETVTTEENQP